MTIIHKFNNLNTLYKCDRFVLSALNLAFIGFLTKNKINVNKDYYLWPDGIISKFFGYKKKIPGRVLIKKINLKLNKVRHVVILGNSSIKINKFLKKKFKKKVVHIQLPNSEVKEIIKKIPKINRNDLYIITLPTPKQEIIATHISNNFKFFKIICIGGGLQIAVGDIKSCPRLLENLGLEFLNFSGNI